MTEPENREERALREALARHADVYDPVDLAMPAPPVRRRWRRIAAAAAVVLVLGGGSGIVAARSHHPIAPTPVARITDGWWATWHDVTVEVPRAWTWATPTIRPDCVRAGHRSIWSKGVPDHPYVAIDTSGEGVPLIGCMPEKSDVPADFGQLPFEYWQPYVAFADPHGFGAHPDGTATYRGWTLTRRTVGDVQVAVLVRPGDHPARILDTARILRLDEEDADGCPPRDPVQSARFVSPPAPQRRPAGTAGVTSVSICQYDRTMGAPAGLMGSRRLTGAAGTGLLGAIDAAPAGSGPNAPQHCAGDDYGANSILLRAHFDTGDHQDAYVYYDSCFGNGVVMPDGTKQLTVADCRPLFTTKPVVLWQAQQAVFDRCSSD